MITTINKSFVLTLVLLLGAMSSYAQLTHPGGWLNSTDLSRIRQKVASGQEPWASAWEDVENKNTGSAQVSSTITDMGALQGQGEDAFILAIKWVATGDQDYATQGINIINAWVNTVNAFDIDDATLRLGIGSNMMANAAEIFAWGFNGASGWSSSEISNAQTWFKDVVYPLTSNGSHRSMNWGTSALAGNMSMAIFCDNITMFNDAIYAYKYGFENTTDGCAGVTQYIINDEGQCFESQRDQGHTQGGIAHLVEPAMIAWNQGVDLVSYSNNRLVAGMEYTAKYNLFNNVSWTNDIPNPCNLSFGWMSNGYISAEDRGDFSPVYVMANTLFEYAGKEHPYTDEVASLTSYFPEEGNSDHPGMGHLLYSGASSITPPYSGFTPDPNKTYYIDAPHHNLRLAANGNSEDPYTLGTSVTGADVEWKFVAKGNGSWHIQRAAGGTLPRLRTDNSADTDMQATGWSGTYTYFDFEEGATTGTYFITLPDGPSAHVRLQIDNSGNVQMVENTRNGTWESFKITEVASINVSPIKIEAEDYDGMDGIQTEGTTDVSGGENIGWIQNGDYLRFDDVNLSGLSNMDARIASNFTGGTIEVRTGSVTGALIGSISIANTGGNQSWVTKNTSISNASGTQDVFLVFTGGSGYLFNVNWIEFNNSSTVNKSVVASAEETEVVIYPNPIASTTTIQGAANSTINVCDINGKLILSQTISSESETLDFSLLTAAGIYYGEVIGVSSVAVVKIVKN